MFLLSLLLSLAYFSFTERAETARWCNVKEKELTFWLYSSDLSLFLRQAVSACAQACVLHMGWQSITVWPSKHQSVLFFVI